MGKKQWGHLAVATAVAALGVLAVPSTAAAAEPSCNVRVISGGAKATCPTGMPGTEFNMGVGCAVWSGGYTIYTRWGGWAKQGSGTSTATCDSGHYVTYYSLKFR